MKEINYEDLAAPTELTKARAEYHRRYVAEGLDHLCDFEWFYTVIWPKDLLNNG